MQMTPLPIPGVLLLEPARIGDHRGFFSTVWSAQALAAAGVDAAFVQDNHSRSRAPGTLRGLHFQAPPAAQGKLVRVARGAIRDVAVDLRADSPTFGRHAAAELSEENWKQMWIPPGCAHGFVTLRPDTEVLYKCTAAYAPDREGGLAFDDPRLGIDWGFEPDRLVLSDRDRRWGTLAEFDTPFVAEGCGAS